MPFKAAPSRAFLDFYVQEDSVQQNEFIGATPDRSFAPGLAESLHLLPAPFTSEDDALGESLLRTYWKAWDLAFRNLHKVQSGSGFIAPYAATAFNDCLFQWDSCFILLFGRYGYSAFRWERTLDNLYTKQHPDGFICREIQEWDGQDRFHRHDPASTGPNILAWFEWEHYLTHHDVDRLRKVFPVLLAYHRWLARYRRWPDGSYWSTGLACGMDNQPRTQAGDSPWVSHSNTAWLDATCQAVLSARLLLRMATELGPPASTRPELPDLRAEVRHLTAYINEHMYDASSRFYVDRRLGSSCARMGQGASGADAEGEQEHVAHAAGAPTQQPPVAAPAARTVTASIAAGGSAAPAQPAAGGQQAVPIAHRSAPADVGEEILGKEAGGSSGATTGTAAGSGPRAAEAAARLPRARPDLSDTLTIGAYWALLADVVPGDRMDAFVAALDDPQHFNRVCRPASLSASHPLYDSPKGGYWLGGVWPSTTYMVLRGLTHVGRHDLAADIAANWLHNCAAAFNATGTLWENLSPDLVGTPGDPAKGDFVGWAGLIIAVLLEYYMGLRADVPNATLVWDIRTTTAFGVLRFPFGAQGIVHLQVAARASLDSTPEIHVSSTVPIKLVVQWGKGMSAVGGQAVDRSGTPAGPVHERVVELQPNMDLSEAAAPPVCLPPHKQGLPVAAGHFTSMAASKVHLPDTSAPAAGGGAAAGGVAAGQAKLEAETKLPAAALVGQAEPVATAAATVKLPPGCHGPSPPAVVAPHAPGSVRPSHASWMRIAGVRPADSPKAAAYKVELE